MITVTAAAELSAHIGEVVVCPQTLCPNETQLAAFLAVSGDVQAMHKPGPEAVVPGNLLITLLPAVIQSGLQVATYRRCYTVGYERIRFRQPVQPGQPLQLVVRIEAVRRRAGQCFVTLAMTLQREDGSAVLELQQTDCYQD